MTLTVTAVGGSSRAIPGPSLYPSSSLYPDGIITATGVGGTVWAFWILTSFDAYGGDATAFGGTVTVFGTVTPPTALSAVGGSATAFGGTISLVVSGIPTVSGTSTFTIRERPPLRLYATVATPSGYRYRWAPDERKPENVPSAVTFSSTMPGGFENCGMTLPRRPELDYRDLEEFSTVTVAGAGGQTAWQGRLERTPRTDGDQKTVSPGLVGWQSALDDNKTARQIYIDIDQTHWAATSTQRKINISAVGFGADDMTSAPDSVSGQPAVITGITDPWSSKQICEAWYDAHGLPISSLYFAWKHDNLLVNGFDTHWNWYAGLSDSSDTLDAPFFDMTPPLRAGTPGSGTRTATAATRDWALLQLVYDTGYAGSSGQAHNLYWTCLAVYGNHGLTPRGTASLTTGPGFYASDVIGHAVSTFAPQLATSRAGESTIQQSDYIINNLAFFDPTTASEIIKQAARFDLQDWAVWDGPCFYFAPRGFYGRSWRARVGPANLSENGPQVDKIWNGVVVSYNDVGGTALTVGPPGSGANYQTTDLLDTSDDNPANQAGIKRWTGLAMGVSAYDPLTTRPNAAIKVGQRFLAEQRLLNTSGDATLTGHVMDSHGVLWPAWAVRAGDTITFTDAHDTTPRRIVRAEYSDATKTCAVSLDSPPESMTQLLERMSMSIFDLGFQ